MTSFSFNRKLRDYFGRELKQTRFMQIIEGLGASPLARIGFPRPFRAVERNQWRKNCLLAGLRHFSLDGGTSSKAEKFIIHQAIIVKEIFSEHPIRENAHKCALH